MKKKYLTTIISALIMIIIFFGVSHLSGEDTEKESKLKVGFIYVGDESTPYTYNFIKAEREIKETFGDMVDVIVKSNVPEGKEVAELEDLANNGCGIIFATSYGYSENVKKIAERYPDIQFCAATGDNANEGNVLKNYHTFMGEIYQGRYISGIVAGMKIEELVKEGKISGEDIKIGYVAAFPYSEVISGYTAFYMGVNSIVPDVKMIVKYTDTWSSYVIEKKCANELIDEGCVIISQHSDTTGPAVACEERIGERPVYHVGYNQSMIDVAPTTSLISSRINWSPYMVNAVKAVMKDKKIEKYIDGNVTGNDMSAGFEKDWVQMMELNEIIAADGTKKVVEKTIDRFKKNKVHVFKGDFRGVNPFDENDTYDLNKEFKENKNSSSPKFNYVLDDVIIIQPMK